MPIDLRKLSEEDFADHVSDVDGEILRRAQMYARLLKRKPPKPAKGDLDAELEAEAAQ